MKSKFAYVLAVTAVPLAMIVGVGSAQATPTPQTVTAQCTTDATGGDGVRHDCDSTATVITAPSGFVFIKDGPKGLAGGETSGNGSEHECRYQWSDYIEVIPGTGITQPRTFTLAAHARSPKGHWAGRGWASCEYVLALTGYQAQ